MMYRNHEGYPDPTAGTALARIEQEEYRLRCPFMPLVYICSPYQGNVEHNTQAAQRYSQFALAQKRLPIAPHLLFPQFMGAETYATRELALHMGMILLTKCHELWYFGDRISEGMKLELNRARLRGIPVRHFNDDCKEVAI